MPYLHHMSISYNRRSPRNWCQNVVMAGRRLGKVRLDGSRSMQGHGSRACYTLGCTEPQCKAANAAYLREYRAGLKVGRPAFGTHQNRKGGFRINTQPDL